MPSQVSGPRAGEETAQIVEAIRQAFAWRPLPGKGDITHCAYNIKYGGQYNVSCFECIEMAQYFAGKHWSKVTAKALRRYGDNCTLFTIEAYCFFLPAYLVAAVIDPEALDDCLDHLTYRFGPRPDDEWSQDRLRAILTELRTEELTVLLHYFERALEKDGDFEDFCQRSIDNIGSELRQRSKPADAE